MESAGPLHVRVPSGGERRPSTLVPLWPGLRRSGRARPRPGDWVRRRSSRRRAVRPNEAAPPPWVAATPRSARRGIVFGEAVEVVLNSPMPGRRPSTSPSTGCADPGGGQRQMASSSVRRRPRASRALTRVRFAVRNCSWASASVSAAMTFTPASTWGSGQLRGRLEIAAVGSRPRPSTPAARSARRRRRAGRGRPASWAPNNDEPRMSRGTYPTGRGVHAGYPGRGQPDIPVVPAHPAVNRSGRGRVAAQGEHRVLVRARSASEAEIDPTRMQRFQGAELLGDGQRSVVGQHHAAGTQADRLGVGGHVGDQHAGRRRRDARHVVVLGVPDPAEAG